MRHTTSCRTKRVKGGAQFSRHSSSHSEKLRNLLGCNVRNKQKLATALVDLIQIMGHDDNIIADDDDDDGVDGLLLPSVSGRHCFSSILEPDHPYTIGRCPRDSHFIFRDPRVSKQHCQILFDAFLKKLYLLSGALLCSSSNCCSSSTCVVDQFRARLLSKAKNKGIACSCCRYKVKASLNGVFVNGVKVSHGSAVELSAGDEVLLVCASRSLGCGYSHSSVGFIVRRIVYQEEVVIPGYGGFLFEWPRLYRPLLSGKVNKRVCALRVSDSESPSSECNEAVERAKSLSACCKRILHTSDPVSFIRKFVASNTPVRELYDCKAKENRFPGFVPNVIVSSPQNRESEEVVPVFRQPKPPSPAVDIVKSHDILKGPVVQASDILVSCEKMTSSQPKDDNLHLERYTANACGIVGNMNANASDLACLDENSPPKFNSAKLSKCLAELPPPPGKNFYLNCLASMQQSSLRPKNVVTLPQLLYPVESISRMFIATFTSDIGWFLSYCDIPSHLPVTLACHNAERCWSANVEMRSSVPYPDFPNLVVVYPPFPEAIAFGGDRKRKGVGCHHPKLFVLQREHTLRVIITSANLVSRQWNDVTNTIWWQDFPRRNSPDCAPLFNQIGIGNANDDLNSDFVAQLAGFMATLVSDVPSQAHWIVELSKYDFTGANAYLVASVPGIHSYKSPFLPLPPYKFEGSEKFFGSVEASVVGLSHLFRAAKDSNGLRLKNLATYLSRSSEKGIGISEIVLRRDKNVPADPNAVSVLVPDPMDSSKGDCVQLGFLPRAVAKWVSPLWDAGFFRFCGYVCPREALAAAFGEDNVKVQLILYVFQGPCFQDMPNMTGPDHTVAFCSLVASIQRCTGLWRLQEVLQQHKWPEHLESDFIYGASSIGTSVNAQFLADFSAAAGKRSQQLFDSQESDPEWGCWDASHELKRPSLRIIFPTIGRVKSAHSGIQSSRCLLCFSEKTWQRLKSIDILHDAVPNPSDRVGHPMHVKVARRRFQSKADTPSFGWIYCGSHNMSCAAWGRIISSQSRSQAKGADKSNSVCQHRLHVCNYELGVIFLFPPPGTNKDKKQSSLDDVGLPFVTPAPKYGPTDRPATMRAMREAMDELAEIDEIMDEEDEEEEVPDEDDEEDRVVEMVKGMPLELEQEEEKAYADVLWSQVESSSQSC